MTKSGSDEDRLDRVYPKEILRTIAEQIGYGRTMQLVSAMWFEKNPTGALSVGAPYLFLCDTPDCVCRLGHPAPGAPKP